MKMPQYRPGEEPVDREEGRRGNWKLLLLLAAGLLLLGLGWFVVAMLLGA